MYSLTSKQNIGIEIECPFSFYFPDLYQKYFHSGDRKYFDFTEEEKKSFSAEITEREKVLLNKLRYVSEENGLKRGKDKY